MLWHSKKRPIPDSVLAEWKRRVKSRESSGEILPNWRKALILAALIAAHENPIRRTSEHGAKLMRQRMAKATHNAQRAKGIKPGQAGRDAMKRNAAERKRKQAGETASELRTSSANMDGI